MAELEIIDAEIVSRHSPSTSSFHPLANKHNDDPSTTPSFFPIYTNAERQAARQLLSPSDHEVVLGAGWTDSDPSSSDEDSPHCRPSSASSTSSLSHPSTPLLSPSTPFNDAFLVRSCSQGWSLSFELHSSQPIPVPSHPDEVLIRNDAVGLNPVDWKSVSYNFGIPAFPWILGRDIAGTVVQVPENNEKGWKVGDRVWTCADSREISAGGYQRYSVHKQGTLAKVPEGMEDEDAATLGTGLVTAAVALFAFFKLPPFNIQDLTEKVQNLKITEEGKHWIVIYGGAAITGIYATQLSSLSNLNIIAVASPASFSYLQSLGVTVCIDRHQPTSNILSSISTTLSTHGAQGKLRYAMDCVSSSTANLCLQALQSNSGGQQAEMICLAGNPKPEAIAQVNKGEEEKVKIHKISFSTTFYHPNGTFAYGVLEYLTKLLERGELKPARPEVLADGLAGIRNGLELLREGKAPRAKKLVVRVRDTPAADVTLCGVKSELGWNGVV
ncbi:uncharacterized protein UHOD_04688 [Ustilago sp. UG-2017b]|nr:uncharacterized protein UHOD_04688 [Ustilago sp. UG-2017b]